MKTKCFSEIETLNGSDFFEDDLIPFEETITYEQSVFCDKYLSPSYTDGERLLLKFALKRLTKRQKEVIKGIYFDGKTNNQLAKELGIDKRAVARHHEAALKKLRRICLGR